jgi:hypothetical protein
MVQILVWDHLMQAEKRMGSSDASRKATEFDSNFTDKDGMNTNDTNSTYGDPTSVPENSQNPSTNQKEDRLENSAPSGMSQHAKSAEKGPDKNRLRKNMDVVLESLVALRKEELES